MATTAATRPEPRPRSDQEARPDAMARLLRDRLSQGLPARISDAVTMAKLATALKNGNGQSALASLKNGEKRRLAKNIDPRRLVN
jgi:hypothetical protein